MFLHAYHRKPKQVTRQLVPDDGFRELDPSSKMQFKDPDTHRIQEKPVQLMVNGKNYSEQQKINRPASGINRTGFGGLLPRHEITHEKSYLNTEYRQFFGEGSKKENDVE